MHNINLNIKKFNKKNITQKYISWLNDKKLMRYSRHKKINYTLKRAYSFYRTTTLSGNLFLSVNDNYKMIGTSIIYMNKFANVGILIGDYHYRGKGLSYQILKKIFIYLKKKKIENIEIGCNFKNTTMIKVIKKLNFKKYKKKKNNIFFYKFI